MAYSTEDMARRAAREIPAGSIVSCTGYDLSRVLSRLAVRVQAVRRENIPPL